MCINKYMLICTNIKANQVRYMIHHGVIGYKPTHMMAPSWMGEHRVMASYSLLTGVPTKVNGDMTSFTVAASTFTRRTEAYTLVNGLATSRAASVSNAGLWEPNRRTRHVALTASATWRSPPRNVNGAPRR